MTIHCFVDCVVNDFLDEMVEIRGTHFADVHIWPLSNGFKFFENGDVFCCIVVCYKFVW